MRKNKPILFVIAIAILFVSSISIWAASNDIKQAEEGYYVKEFSADDFANYRGADVYKEPRLGKDGVSEHDYLFAGWYKDFECTTPYTTSAKTAVDSVAYAKFVSADVMQVKCMVTEGTTADSDTTNLRMISTVDSRFYSEMGFNVSLNGGEPISCVEETGFARITDTVGGLQVGYSPIAFNSSAKYFFTHSITGITDEYFNDFFTIQPYWVTTDGTTVQGVERCLKVSDSYNKVLNLPIHLDSDATVSETKTFTVSYDSEKFSYMQDSFIGDVFGENAVSYSDDGAGEITVTVSPSSEVVLDGMLGNLRLQLKDDLIDSTTEFTVAENELNITNLAYKNFATSYTPGTSDTSWYVGFEENEEFVVSSVADLQGLAELVNDGNTFEEKTIILGSDIIGYTTSVISNGAIVEGQEPKAMTPIGTYKDDTSYAFNGTFDGGNNTISGLYISKSGYCGLFGECGTDSMIKNLKISNSLITNTSANITAAVVGRTYGNVENVCVDDDVIIKGKNYVGGIVGSYETNEDTVSIKQCSFYGTIDATSYIGGIVGRIFKGPKNIEDCLSGGTIKYSKSEDVYAGGIVGAIQKTGKLTPKYEIVNCASYTTLTATTAEDTSTVGVVIGGASGVPIVTIKNVYYTTDSETLVGYGTDSVLPTNATVTGAPGKLNVELTGVNAYKYTGLDFTSDNAAWVVVDGTYPQLKSFAEGTIISDLSSYQRADKGWYYNSFRYNEEGTQTIDIFTVTSVDDMFGLADLVNTDSNDFENLTVQMGNDIIFNDVQGGEAEKWADGTNLPSNSMTSIGTSDNKFNGTFDGGNNTISGIYVLSNGNCALFGYCGPNSTISNLKLTNSFYNAYQKTNGGNYSASIVARTQGNVENIYVDVDVIIKGKKYVGGIVGSYESNSEAVSIKKCSFNGSIEAYSSCVGGIAGRIYRGSKTIENCFVTGSINYTTSENVGGIVGSIEKYTNDTNAVYYIRGCVSCVELATTATEDLTTVGAVIGGTSSVPTVTIENVYYTTDSETLGGYGTTSVATGNATVTGSPQKIDDLTGKNAYIFTNLDLTSENPIWVAVEGQNPQLSTFATGTPITDLEQYKYQRNDIDWYYNGFKYDEDGAQVAATYTVKDEDDMYGFAKLVNTGGKDFAGEIVQMGQSIVFNNAVDGNEAEAWAKAGATGNTGTENEENGVSGVKREWIPIGTTTTHFQGRFYGQGHTLSGIYIHREDMYSGLFALTEGATIEDLNLKNSYYQSDYISNSARMGSFVGSGDGTFIDVYADVIMKSLSNQVGGIIGYVMNPIDKTQTVLSMTNCWFDGQIDIALQYDKEIYSGGLAGYVTNGSMEIDTCLYTGKITADTTEKGKSHYVGGLIASTHANMTTRTIKNTLCAGSIELKSNSEPSYVGKIMGRDRENTEGDVAYKTSNTNVSVTTTLTHIQGETETEKTSLGAGLSSAGVQTLEDTSYLNGKLAHVMTNLQFVATEEGQNIWAVRLDTYPIPKTLADESEIIPIDDPTEKLDTEFETEVVDGITITKIQTIGELYGLALLSQENSFVGTNFQLKADLDLNPGEDADDWYNNGTEAILPWIQPIGNATYPFAGTFDGDKHTISGLYMKDDTSSYVGMFASTTATACIQDVRLTNSYLHSGKKTATRRLGSFVAQATDTTLSGLYSDAILMMEGLNNKVCYTGGIVGRTLADETVTISNCWFSGDIYCGDIHSSTDKVYDENNNLWYNVPTTAGGIIGAAFEGTTVLENCLFDGDITCTYDKGEYAYLGGMCGQVYKDGTTVLNINSCISVGNIYDSNKGYGVGAVVGVVDSEVDSEGVAQAAHLKLTNVFAARDSVSTGATTHSVTSGEVTATATMEGSVTWTNQKDRLMGYCTQATVDGVTPSLSSEDWTMRLSGAPIPTSLTNVLGESDIVATDTLDAELGLNTTGIELNLSSALNTGLGNYTLTKQDVEPATVTAYRAALEDSLGFDEVYKNGVVENEGVVTYDVYNGSFVKDEGNWLLQVIYSASNKVLNITISTEGRSALSTRLSSDSTQVSEENTNPVKLAMLSLTGSVVERESLTYYYGNSFVFTLPQDGHYIICDGGNKSDLTGLLKYVRKNTAADGNVYIDAWVVSHQHGDHFSVIENVYSDPTLIEGVYVEAFYMNEPNATTYDADSINMDLKSHNQRRAMALFKTAPEGETSKIYRMSTGQKYYFDGLSMDVILTHDVMNLNLNSTERHDVSTVNRSSAIVLFTTDKGEKIFIGGDADHVNMKYIVSMYGQDAAGYTSSTLLQGIDVFVALHHGKNSSYASNSVAGDNTFVNYLTTDTSMFTYVLYPCSFEYGVDATLTDENFQNVGTVNEYLNTRTQYHYDFGDGHVIIDFSTM